MAYEIWTKANERVVIDNDPDSESPREWQSENNTLVAICRRYKIGDREPNSDDELETVRADETLAVLPVYMYDHSGIALNTKPFSCPWDSGMIGYIFEKIGENETREQVEQRLAGDIETYSQYLNGEVFWFKREKKNECETCSHVTWEHIDSCCGFIGAFDESGLYEAAFPEGKEGWELSNDH